MTAAQLPTYRVELDHFRGPLDLLLYLVRRNELSVTAVPVSSIVSQFVDFMQGLAALDLEQVGEFVVLSSTLVELKSREVIPETTESDEPAADPSADEPRSELIEQLLQYKRYREAGLALEERAATWQLRYPRLHDDRPQATRNLSQDRIKEVELWDLVSALGRVLQKQAVETNAKIRYDETPISVYVERISERVRAEGRVRFSSFFGGLHVRSQIIGVFLAILELLRHHHYRAEQPADYGEIFVLPPVETAAEPVPTEPPAAEAGVPSPAAESVDPTATSRAADAA